jgi:hypothetical protein
MPLLDLKGASESMRAQQDMSEMDLKGLDKSLSEYFMPTSDGWGEWEATPTVVLNADADYGRDGSFALLGTSDTFAPTDFFVI